MTNGEVGGGGEAGVLMLPVYLARWGVCGLSICQSLGPCLKPSIWASSSSPVKTKTEPRNLWPCAVLGCFLATVATV